MGFGKIVLWAWAITAMVGLLFVSCVVIEAAGYIGSMNKIEKMASRLVDRMAKVTVILMIVSICITVVFGAIKLISCLL